MPASCVVDREFEPWSAQIKDYDIGICYLTAKNTSLRGQSKDCLPKIITMCPSVEYIYLRNAVSVSYHYKIPTKCIGLEQSGHHHHHHHHLVKM